MLSKQRNWMFMLAVFSLLILAACGNGDDASADEGGADDGSYDLKDSYTVVSDNSFVPFEFMEDGELVGFDIELITAIAEEAGFEVDGEIQTTNFDGIIPGLQTGQFEIAVAGISITEDRKGTVDFSDPYYESGLAIAVREDNEDINNLEDLEGKTIATRLGSTSAKFLEENLEDKKIDTYEQLDQVYMAVENGSADAVMYDLPNVEYYIATTGDGLKVVGDLYQAEDYGIAISKGNEDLVAAVNDALATLKENGTYDEIYDKWFGASE
ncbi:transporter substrate-binding domain-containing protein [Oceanobacillus sp. J11TS1]|uniref:transporter substrate-binding domain-containing protein n=1 Tax=Oceanobacillus sp. J11TS1 TaxID=2807191 RepID=UPI001B2B3255|nr:transporter substrate-binding domain-containing protein [Oceanobacillus sp. J11TS1]GIO21527.1 glutamine ABC transporter substrate-binding protein GlnH [Oceanobacillus sp. J11TS1]